MGCAGASSPAPTFGPGAREGRAAPGNRGGRGRRLVPGLGPFRWCGLTMGGGHNATSRRVAPKGTGGARPGPSVRQGGQGGCDTGPDNLQIPSCNLRAPRGHAASPESQILEVLCPVVGWHPKRRFGKAAIRDGSSARFNHEGVGEAGGDHDAEQNPLVREIGPTPGLSHPARSDFPPPLPEAVRPWSSRSEEELRAQREQLPVFLPNTVLPARAPALPVLTASCAGEESSLAPGFTQRHTWLCVGLFKEQSPPEALPEPQNHRVGDHFFLSQIKSLTRPLRARTGARRVRHSPAVHFGVCPKLGPPDEPYSNAIF